jgi:hypothetical protein
MRSPHALAHLPSYATLFTLSLTLTLTLTLAPHLPTHPLSPLLPSCQLATLLLSFYCNLALSEYKLAYMAATAARQRVIDLLTLAAGTMGDKPRARPLLLDIWRCANLMHVASYAHPPSPET